MLTPDLLRQPNTPDVAETELNQALEVFLAQRVRLFSIAFRVVGDAAIAEDVVQDAWLRWQRTDREIVRNPAAFLTTSTTRLAINVISSARHRHETLTDAPVLDLIGSWQDPTSGAERAYEAEQALGRLMARLSSSELAAYLLRKGFDYPYQGIALLLRTSVPNARQLVRRAQLRVSSDCIRPVDLESKRCLVRAFLAASRTGELDGLEQLLTAA